MTKSLWGFIPGEDSWSDDSEAFKPRSGALVDEGTSMKIRGFITAEVTAIMSWYTNCPIPGDPIVDCQETRRNINADLAAVFPKAEEKFGLKKIPRVLRVRSGSEPGMLVVRAEALDLS